MAASLGLCACQNMPEPYAPPEQRPPVEDFRPYRISQMIPMSGADAPSHFVQDISDNLEGSWRWAGQRPVVRVRIRTNEHLKYVIEFALPEATLRDTGPVTLSFFVNDRLLDRVKYSSPGQLRFEKPVPPEWIAPDQDAILAAEIDKLWVSKTDGARLGFILTRIGLTQ